MPLNVEDISPVSVPPVIGGAVLDAEPLRHGQANAAAGGIWRVRGPAGTAILKVARPPAGTDPAKAFPGLREGGWTGSDDAVRAAIHACGAAKYSWFGPAMAVRAARDDLGRSSYRQDTSAASAIARLTPLVTLIADWARS